MLDDSDPKFEVRSLKFKVNCKHPLTPTVAIAVPSLNQGHFLGAALESLRGTRARVHRAVLDGGSQDTTRGVLEASAAELAFWRSEPDAGQAAAINEGVSRLLALEPSVLAVGWLNADDLFLAGGLDALAEALLDHPAWMAVAGRAVLADEAGRLGEEIPTRRFDPDSFAESCTISQPATLIRREAWERLGGLDVSLDMCFDYDLWWRVARLGSIGYLDQVVAASRDHQDTKTRLRRARYFQEAKMIVHRERGAVPWHWYISEALERETGYQLGRRPGFLGSVRAGATATLAYARGRLEFGRP